VGTGCHPASFDLRSFGLAAPRPCSGVPGDLPRSGPSAVAILLGALFLNKDLTRLKNSLNGLFYRCLLKVNHYMLYSVSPEAPYMHARWWDEIAYVGEFEDLDTLSTGIGQALEF
jgi:hypothetical protein